MKILSWGILALDNRKFQVLKLRNLILYFVFCRGDDFTVVLKGSYYILVRVLFLCNVFLLVAFPLGSLNVLKLLFLVLFLFMLFCSSIRGDVEIKFKRKYLLLFVAFLLVLCLSTISAIFNNKVSLYTVMELRSFLLILVVVFFGLLLIYSNIVSHILFYRILIISLTFYGVIKITLFFLVSLNLEKGLDLLSWATPTKEFLVIGGFPRIVFVNDFLFPFSYFYIDKARFSKSLSHIFKGIFVISMFITVTRYIWFVFVILFISDMILRGGFISKVKRAVFLFTIITLLMLVIINDSTFVKFKIHEILILRFGTEGKLSLWEKAQQSIYLLKEFSLYPIFGKGMGTYIENYIRDERLKYGYEVFILLLLMQFGVLNMSLLLAIIFSPFLVSICKKFTKEKVFSLISFTMFFLAGVINPVILSATSSVLYLLFYSSLIIDRG